MAFSATLSSQPDRRRTAAAMLTGAAAMVFVGTSIAISDVLATAPLFTVQAVRYAGACLLLVCMARLSGRRLLHPVGSEWGWIAAIAAAGLGLFNLGLVRGAAHAEPAVFGVAVASVPVLLAVAGPLLDGRPPAARIVAAAVVVTTGCALVQGTGRTDLIGVGWAAVVLGCEAAFTLLAVPVLRRLGAWSVSVYTTAAAVGILGGLGVAVEGPGAVTRITGAEVAATGYLAVVTAIAFVFWYSAVSRLGPGRAGLLTGVAPVAAAAAGMVLGGPAPAPLVWLGMAVVAGGLAAGLRPVSRRSTATVARGRRTPVVRR